MVRKSEIVGAMSNGKDNEEIITNVATLRELVKNGNGGWLQKAIFTALLANIGLIIVGAGTLFVNHRVLSDTVFDLRALKIDHQRLDNRVTKVETVISLRLDGEKKNY